MSAFSYSKGKTPLGVIIAVLVVIAIFAVLYLFSFKNISKVSPTPTPALPKASVSPSPKGTPTKSPSPTPVPKEVKITVGSVSMLDGYESSDGTGANSTDIRAGRNLVANTRGFVAFQVPSELSGKQVDSANLRIYQAQVVGTPYQTLGNLWMDHLDYGTSLDSSDYSVTAINGNFAIVTNDAAIEYKDVNVKDMLINDLANGRTYSEYRIHFENENTGGSAKGDYAYFEGQANTFGTGNRPQLVITYH